MVLNTLCTARGSDNLCQRESSITFKASGKMKGKFEGENFELWGVNWLDENDEIESEVVVEFFT